MQNITMKICRRLRNIFQGHARPQAGTQSSNSGDLSRATDSASFVHHGGKTVLTLGDGVGTKTVLAGSTTGEPSSTTSIGSRDKVKPAQPEQQQDSTPDHATGEFQREVEADFREGAAVVALLQPTLEEARAIREENYLTFDGEDENDYTDGPPRIVVAEDGLKQCAALLLTLPLSLAMQKAVTAQKKYVKARETALRRKEALMYLSFDINAQIARHRSRLTMVRQAESNNSGEQTPLEEELSTLELMLEDNKIERQAIQNNIEFQCQMLQEVQAKVNTHLEEALTKAQLLEQTEEEPDAVQETLDLQKEYQVFRQKVQEANGGSPVPIAPLDTSKDHMMSSPMTEEEKEIERLQRDAWEADQRLRSAQNAFDRRSADRLDAEDAAIQAWDPENGLGVEDAMAEFDVSWHKHEQDLTRELIDAEQALQAAKAAAVDGGADLAFLEGDDQESGFLDDVGDGYRLSFEEEMIRRVPVETIQQWLLGVPSEPGSPNASHLSREEADEWEIEELDFGDSSSAFAEGAERERIDRWKSMNGL